VCSLRESFFSRNQGSKRDPRRLPSGKKEVVLSPRAVAILLENEGTLDVVQSKGDADAAGFVFLVG
jgi:hypothetical protein